MTGRAALAVGTVLTVAALISGAGPGQAPVAARAAASDELVGVVTLIWDVVDESKYGDSTWNQRLTARLTFTLGQRTGDFGAAEEYRVDTSVTGRDGGTGLVPRVCPGGADGVEKVTWTGAIDGRSTKREIEIVRARPDGTPNPAGITVRDTVREVVVALGSGRTTENREVCGQTTTESHDIPNLDIYAMLIPDITVPLVEPGHWSLSGSSKSPLFQGWFQFRTSIQLTDPRIANPRTTIDIYDPSTFCQP